MMPQDTHTHTHSHTGSSASSPDTVGRPLIPQHIYNLCNDNLIPPAGHGEHTLPFCSSRSLPKPEHGRVSSNSCFSALFLPLSPGLRSADCSSHSPRPGAGSDPGADLLKKTTTLLRSGKLAGIRSSVRYMLQHSSDGCHCVNEQRCGIEDIRSMSGILTPRAISSYTQPAARPSLIGPC